MSSIGSATSQQYSPLDRLKTELASEVKSGSVSASDQSAMSSALDDIDSAMQSSKPPAGAKPSSDDMKSKIDDLIAGEVSSGKLTSDQADQLKNVFSSTFKGGKGGPGGPGGAGGPPPGGPPPSDSSSSDDSSSTTSATSSADSDTSKLLQDFLDSIKSSQSKSANYSDGGSSLQSSIEALVVDYQA